MSRTKNVLILCIAVVMVMAFSVPSWSGDTVKITAQRDRAKIRGKDRGIP